MFPECYFYSPLPHLKRLWQKTHSQHFPLRYSQWASIYYKVLKVILNKPTNCNLSWSNLLDLGNLLTVSIILWNNYSKNTFGKCVLPDDIRVFTQENSYCSSLLLWYEVMAMKHFGAVYWTKKVRFYTWDNVKLSTKHPSPFYNGETSKFPVYILPGPTTKMIPWK